MYLVFVKDTSIEPSTVKSILVVREFSNVFPANLSSILPDSDVVFGIDLVRGNLAHLSHRSHGSN